MEADIPLGWKSLNLERYGRTIDLDEHLNVFLTHANLYTKDDVILYRVFPTSFKRVTLIWYCGLPLTSTDNFDTLVKRFNVQYATSRSHHMVPASLASLRQADDESLEIHGQV